MVNLNEPLYPVSREINESEIRTRTVHPRSPARKGTIERTEEPSARSFKEKLVMQCVVCGVFMALIMFINTIDTEFSVKITGFINKQIIQNTDVKALAQNSGEKLTAFISDIKVFLGIEQTTDGGLDKDKELDKELDQEQNKDESNSQTAEENLNPTDYIRVDEEVFKELENAGN